MKASHQFDRRDFIKSTAVITSGSLGLTVVPEISLGRTLNYDERINVIGPRQGFSPQIGTLLSMMTWMRSVILGSVKHMTQDQLDYVHDEKSNSIGALLLHLAATERYYQIHTFDNKKWGDWSEQDKKRFDIAMTLGDNARVKIKGDNLNFYLDTLSEVRANTIDEFKKRDDAWLFTVDDSWSWGPTNNYCKWFHVCEHESNHNGQIKWLKRRLPGTKEDKD
jgi:uncharacterized damage-inducible protein DinB